MEENDKLFTAEEVKPTSECVEFIENGEGIYLSSEDDFREDQEVLKPETYQFAKWLKHNRPEIHVEISPCENVIDLKSYDIWLPLVFLATNVALPLFINFAYDYLKSAVRGRLSKDDPKVHLRVIYKDKDKFRKLEYTGSIDALKELK